MKSFDRTLTVSEFEHKIKDTAIDVVNDLGYGKSSQGKYMVQFCNAMDLPKLASPQMSLSTGTYEGTQTCIITCEDPSATILYTTDGTYPDVTTALEYSVPIKINEYTQIHAVEENYISPTCTSNGSKDVVVYCSVCNEEISRETVTLEAMGHIDAENDGYCDSCDEQICDHECHKSGIIGFIWKVINFVNKLFGLSKTCDCGVAHY